MPSMIDQIRALKLPSNMMQFAARGALQVPAAENIEILVHLTLHNKVFGDLARMTLAGWDEKACLTVVSDPKTPREVLNYFIAPDNLRPKLLPALLENPSVSEGELTKLAVSASRETIEAMLNSARVRSMRGVLGTLRANPYVKKEEAEELNKQLKPQVTAAVAAVQVAVPAAPPATASVPPAEKSATSPTETTAHDESSQTASDEISQTVGDGAGDQEVSAYLSEHASEIAAEGEKPFQSIGGVVELLGSDYFPVTHEETVASAPAANAETAALAAKPAATAAPKKPPTGQDAPRRENTLQKINRLDVKGRIQLALKGNKEERSILIRDGTKVVALAVLEAPKLADGEVEKFASQKNVLEAVLRQIPLKRRFMKNYVVVRNLVGNPRTPLDLGLGLMKNLLVQDLKNLSANKEVSETIRKLALKMYKQKLDDAKKK
jgi:hypothetical protein